MSNPLLGRPLLPLPDGCGRLPGLLAGFRLGRRAGASRDTASLSDLVRGQPELSRRSQGRPACPPRACSCTAATLASTLLALELDHVLIAVADLAAAGRELEARHGLASIEGGHHAGYGTANRLVPLGDSYLELVTVADESEAARSPFGSWVARMQSERGRPLGWAVRTHGLDAVARRLELTIRVGSRPMSSGAVLRWRLAGLERVAAEPSLPFFIEWAEGAPFPGRVPARHPAGAVRIAELRLAGDSDRLADWLGTQRLPIALRRGPSAVVSIVLAGPAGEIVLGADQP